MKSGLIKGGVLLFCASAVLANEADPAFINFETAPVHPIALSPDGHTLAVCNLPDGRVELFDVASGIPVANGNVPVGLDPVSLRFRSTNELWVANFISSSVNIIDVSSKRVVATLNTFNGPSDIVFAGTPERAFVSCNRSNAVMVFNPITRTSITNIVIDGERPRAMAVSPDGAKVYVAIFESGNASTIAALASPQFLQPGDDPDDPPEMTTSILQLPYGPYKGITPPPNIGTNLFPALRREPLVLNDYPTFYEGRTPDSIIVKKSAAGRWMDDNNGDWTEFISGTNAPLTGRIPNWDMPDHDLAIIDTATDSVTYAAGLMNICMNLAVNPASGAVTVIGTDATNERRFEPNVRGTFVRVNVALVNPTTLGKTIVDLNPHLDYSTSSVPQSVRDLSLGDPRGIVWNSNGTRGYVTGMGSRNLGVIDGNGHRVMSQPIELSEGPTGLALDESRQRLYVLNRFSSRLSVLDTTSLNVVTNVALLDPTPAAIKIGRKHLYDTRRNSGLGHVACGSCHVDARFDRLAWDLSNPTAPTFVESSGVPLGSFHPLKGPLVTQTLQDIIGSSPTSLHWRGDRKNIESFDITFRDLLGADSVLATNDMQEFKTFLQTIAFPPNPFRNFDNSVPTNLPLPGLFGRNQTPLPAGVPSRGGKVPGSIDNLSCTTCHEGRSGFGSGADELNTPRGAIAVDKASQLRSVADKLGFSLSSTNSRAGFGLRPDGRVDTFTRFLASVFDFTNDQDIADTTAFVLTGFPNELPAALGRQVTLATTGSNALAHAMISLAKVRTNHVELVARGLKDGLSRSWWYDVAIRRFQSDRNGETIAIEDLLMLADPGQELTFTMVAEGTGLRLANDRDGEGTYDRTELDFGFNPDDPLSNSGNAPPHLPNQPHVMALHSGMTFLIPFTATDANQPAQALHYTLTLETPDGATLNPTNGVFTWTPTVAQGDRTNWIGVEVTDNGTPALHDRTLIELNVVNLRATDLQLGPGANWTPRLEYRALVGHRYQLQFKNYLEEPAWTGGEIRVATGSFAEPLIRTDVLIDWGNNLTTNSSQRFYRIIRLE